jgi:tetratricopeptide (TPR) repeat protein
LGRFNALEIPHVYFEEAMTRLRNRFLKQPVITATKSISGVEEATVQRKMFIAANQPAPTQDELKSEMYFWRALARNDNSDAEIADYTEAIRLNPGDVDAYNNRAEAYFARGNYVEALSDFQKAAAIQPDDNYVIGGLAVTHHKLGDLEEAKRLWLLLVNQNRKFLSVDWVQAVLNWHDSLAGEAHKLIDNL